MNDELDFAGAIAVLIALALAFLWTLIASSKLAEWVTDQADKFKRRRLRKVPEHQHRYMHQAITRHWP